MTTLPATGRLLAEAALLSLWLGAALLVAAVVAPAAFALLPTRTLAGALVGRVLPPLFLVGIVIGLVAALLAWRTDGEPYARGRAIAAAIVALACAIAQLVVAPRIAAVRAAIGTSIDALSPDDPRRIAFGRLHGFSVLWLGAAMLAAGVAIVLAGLAARAGGRHA